MASTNTQFRYVGRTANTIEVGDKLVPVGPGDMVKLSDKDLDNSHNQSLLTAGFLIEVESGKDKKNKEVKND